MPVPDGARWTARRGSPAQAPPHGDRNPAHNGKSNRTAGPSHSIAPDTLAYSTSTSNATLLGPCPDDTAARARSANTARATSPDANAQPKAACGGSAEKVATNSAVGTRKARRSERSGFGLDLGKQMLQNRQRRRKRQRQGLANEDNAKQANNDKREQVDNRSAVADQSHAGREKNSRKRQPAKKKRVQTGVQSEKMGRERRCDLNQHRGPLAESTRRN